MYYITMKQHRKPRQLTWEEVIAGVQPKQSFFSNNSNITSTITRCYKTVSKDFIDAVNVPRLISWLKAFNNENKDLYTQDKAKLYKRWYLPKKTGGSRPIDEPVEPLRSQLTRLMLFLRDDCNLLYHTSAFAYVKGRCIVDHNKKHVENKSNWYLKTDFKDFFPNTNLDFVMKMLGMIFPTSEICKNQEGYAELRKALSLNYKSDGTMPQGTTLSPFISNWVMIPIDYAIFNKLAEIHIVYTRYADDMTFSAQEKFPQSKVLKIIEDVLSEFDAPYKIKSAKTRYGSVKGKNWNLGLMCNGQYEITVGAKKKRYFKAMLCSFILDTKNGKYWMLDDVQRLRGLLSYYLMIERNYFNNVVRKQSSKWNVDVYELFKKYMRGTYS